MSAELISGGPGPHAGWYDVVFLLDCETFRLRTIADSDPRSYLSRVDREERPTGSLMSFPGILEMGAAVAIIQLLKREREEGRMAGKNEARREMKEALGI